MKYTAAELKEKITAALSHNFGVSPEQASDEFFYKATVMVLLDIMRDRRADFRKQTEEQQEIGEQNPDEERDVISHVLQDYADAEPAEERKTAAQRESFPLLLTTEILVEEL